MGFRPDLVHAGGCYLLERSLNTSRLNRLSVPACVAFSLCASAFTLDAQAATVFGVYAGGGVWSQEVEGSASSLNAASSAAASVINVVDLEDDLGFDDKRNRYLYAGIEHPIPLLPNIRVDHTEISQSANGQLNRSIEFNGRTFDLSADVSSEVDLDQTDLVLYYELLDTVISLDLGVGARYVDGFVRVADDTGFASAEFKGALPLVYLGGRFDLPLTGFWAAAQARGLTYKGERLVDADARVGWESDLGLGVELGYRFMDLELDEFDDIDSADLTIKGPFAGLTFSF